MGQLYDQPITAIKKEDLDGAFAPAGADRLCEVLAEGQLLLA